MANAPIPSPDSAATQGTAAAPIGADRACMKCGYNLRGLDPAGRCPECGVAVAESLRTFPYASDFSAALTMLRWELALEIASLLPLLTCLPVVGALAAPVLWVMRVRTALLLLRPLERGGFGEMAGAASTVRWATRIGLGGGGVALVGLVIGIDPDARMPATLGMAAGLLTICVCWGVRLWGIAVIVHRLDALARGHPGGPEFGDGTPPASFVAECFPAGGVATLLAATGWIGAAVAPQLSWEFGIIAAIAGLTAVVFLAAGWYGLAVQVRALSELMAARLDAAVSPKAPRP
jgi:hypothetical protein